MISDFNMLVFLFLIIFIPVITFCIGYLLALVNTEPNSIIINGEKFPRTLVLFEAEVTDEEAITFLDRTRSDLISGRLRGRKSHPKYSERPFNDYESSN